MCRASQVVFLSLCLIAAVFLVPGAVQAQQNVQADDLEYTPEQIRANSAESFLGWIAKPQPGYQKFAAMHALGRKAKESDPKERWNILSLVAKVMYDQSRSEYQRFQCCYVISDCGDEQWVPTLKWVLDKDQSVTMRSVAAEALGYFTNCAAAKDALREASEREKDPKVREVLDRRLNPGSGEYSQEEIKSIAAEFFLEKLARAEAGRGTFAALHALAKKAKDSAPEARRTILAMVVKTMNDKSRIEYQRWQCCYVISDCGDDAWVQPLIDVLMTDPSSTMRAVAAEALAKFPGNTTAHDALVRASGIETNQKVIDVLNRVLAKKDAGS